MSAYLYDMPTAGRRDSYANAFVNSGAGSTTPPLDASGCGEILGIKSDLMRLWPWWTPRETRAEAYTDTVIAAILAGARGTVVEGLTAGVEVAAGYWGRAFSSGSIVPDGVIARGDGSRTLVLFGRSLVVEGEAVFEIVLDGGLKLRPAGLATVTGPPDPESWTYELTMSGPSQTFTLNAAGGPCVTSPVCGGGETPLAWHISG